MYESPVESTTLFKTCQYGTSPVVFRGPRRSLEQEYVVILGGTEAYGKFIPRPFPNLVEKLIGRPVVNLGRTNAGPQTYLADTGLQEVVTNASDVIVQITGAQNVNNAFYRVHPRQNDRLVCPNPILTGLYPDVDFTQFHYVRHMLIALQTLPDTRFETVIAALQAAWVQSMQRLLTGINAPTVLFWFADHSPETPQLSASGPDPLFITAQMLQDIATPNTTILHSMMGQSANIGDFSGMVVRAEDATAALRVPRPFAHELAAQYLAQHLISQRDSRCQNENGPGKDAGPSSRSL